MWKKMSQREFFFRIITYCILLFGGLKSSCLKELQIFRNQAAQIECRAPPRYKRVLLFEKVKWFTVYQIVAYQTLVNVYKICKNSEQEYLSGLLNWDGRGLRIMRTNTKLNLAQKSFTFRGASLWNQLASDVRNSMSISFFQEKG